MQPGQSVVVQLVDSTGARLGIPNVIVESHFFVNGVFRYSFKIGRTDTAGQLRFSYADVDALRRQHGVENLMDYNTLLDACDSVIDIVVPSENELRQQRENAVRVYGRIPTWAEDWPANGPQRASAKVALNPSQQNGEVRVSVP